MQVEPVNEEEVTKIEVTGTHDYPSAPGFVFLDIWSKGVPISTETATRTEPNKSAIDLAVRALKEKERKLKYV